MNIIKNITSTLIRKYNATHAMAVEKGNAISCAATFEPSMFCMAEVIDAQKFLKSKGFESDTTVVGIKPCVTWQMPAHA